MKFEEFESTVAVLAKYKEFGDDVTDRELKFVAGRVKDKTPEEAFEYFMAREEYFEIKLGNIYNDTEQMDIDKQGVSTEMMHAIRKIPGIEVSCHF